MEAIIFSILSFISTSLGGLFAIKNKDKLKEIMSFTAGVLIAVCFFDILPEVFRLVSTTHIDIVFPMTSLVLGFLFFHLLEKSILIHHAHEVDYAEHKHPSVGLIGAFGLAFHSFLDGVGIGLGFHVSLHVGFLISLAVIAHDFSDGLNTVTIMLNHKNTTAKAKLLLVLDASTPILGALSTFLFTLQNKFLVVYLGFFAGFLLYIGASDLLPEAHSKRSSYKMLGLTILGMIFIFLITRFT